MRAMSQNARRVLQLGWRQPWGDEFSSLNGDNDLQDRSQNEKTYSPYSEGDQDLQPSGHVFPDLTERRGYEPRNNQPHALFDPYADDDEHASDVQRCIILSCHGYDEDHEGSDIERKGRPYPRDHLPFP